MLLDKTIALKDVTIAEDVRKLAESFEGDNSITSNEKLIFVPFSAVAVTSFASWPLVGLLTDSAVIISATQAFPSTVAVKFAVFRSSSSEHAKATMNKRGTTFFIR